METPVKNLLAIAIVSMTMTGERKTILPEVSTMNVANETPTASIDMMTRAHSIEVPRDQGGGGAPTKQRHRGEHRSTAIAVKLNGGIGKIGRGRGTNGIKNVATVEVVAATDMAVARDGAAIPVPRLAAIAVHHNALIYISRIDNWKRIFTPCCLCSAQEGAKLSRRSTIPADCRLP
jgi:hypothetical protein